MANPARRIEITGEKVPFEIAYRGPMNVGAKMVVRYSIDGGPVHDADLAGTPPIFRFDVDEGSEVEFQVFEKDAAGALSSRSKKRKEIVTAPSAAPTWAPGAPAATSVDASMKSITSKVVDLLKNSDASEQSLYARFEQVKLLAKTPRTPLPEFLASLQAVLAERNDISPELKKILKSNPASTADEFMDRVTQASEAFRKRVWLSMKANPEVAKAFRVKGKFDAENPFSNRRLNAVFDEVCRTYDFGGVDGVARMRAAMEKIDPSIIPLSPAAPARMDLLKRIINRTKEKTFEGRKALERAEAHKVDRALSLAIQTGGILAAAGGSFGIGLGLLAAKPALEAICGIKGQDVIAALQHPKMLKGISGLWKTFWQNNILTDVIRNRESGVKEILKSRLKFFGKGAIPLVGPFLDNDQVTVGGYEKPEEFREGTEGNYEQYAAMVRKAC